MRHLWRQSRFHPETIKNREKILIALRLCQRNWSTGFVSHTSYSMESLRWHAKVFGEELLSIKDIFSALEATESALVTRYTRNCLVAILRTTQQLTTGSKNKNTPLNSPVALSPSIATSPHMVDSTSSGLLTGTSTLSQLEPEKVKNEDCCFSQPCDLYFS